MEHMNLAEAPDTAATHHVDMLLYGRRILVQDAAFLQASGLLQTSAIFNFPPFDGTNEVLHG